MGHATPALQPLMARNAQAKQDKDAVENGTPGESNNEDPAVAAGQSLHGFEFSSNILQVSAVLIWKRIEPIIPRTQGQVVLSGISRATVRLPAIWVKIWVRLVVGCELEMHWPEFWLATESEKKYPGLEAIACIAWQGE